MRGIHSQSSDSDDGPSQIWSNALTGRMRGLDDEDESASSEEELACQSEVRDAGQDIDFL